MLYISHVCKTNYACEMKLEYFPIILSSLKPPEQSQITNLSASAFQVLGL
jgi:hypothetical protein